MFNKVILVGRITREMTLENTNSGKVYINTTLAVSNFFNKNKNTDFINITVWNQVAENMIKFLKKGSLILIEGRLQINVVGPETDRRTYHTVVANKVVFLESKNTQKKEPDSNKKTIVEEKKDDGDVFKNSNDNGIEWE